MTPNDRIRELRKYLNMNQEVFGEAIGLTKSGISAIENGNRAVTSQHVKLLISAFNINEHWLRAGEGTMFIDQNRAEELAQYTAMLLKDTDSLIVEGIKNFIITYEQLDHTSKQVLEKLAVKYLDNLKKDQL